MTHTDVIPTSASVASTGKGIRYIGNYAYAYSGPVGTDNSTTTLLEFTTGSGLFDGWYYPMFMTGLDQSRNYTFTVNFNGLKVIIRVFTQIDNFENNPGEIKILIPPRTEVLITALNLADTETHNMGAKLIGRVYGAE